MPIRFTSPSLGGQRQVFLQGGEWEFGLAYRHLAAHDWFVGDKVDQSSAPNGGHVRFDIHTIAISMAYGITERLSVQLAVPVSTGTESRIHPDGVRHMNSAAGFGDANLVGRFWLLDPASHRGGNLSLGLGVKAPTGNNAVKGDFGLPTGTVQWPVHPGLELGDGGWGVLLEAQAFQRVAYGLSAYLYGFYQLSPRDKSSVTLNPMTTMPLSVPDHYDARLGLAYAVWPRAGFSASLGARIDGMPVHDLIGGSGGYRDPGYILYLDPGASLSWGREVVTASVPIRLHGRFERNLNDLAGGPGPHGDRGDLASYLIFLGYARRF
jgi:hypothetical protein